MLNLSDLLVVDLGYFFAQRIKRSLIVLAIPDALPAVQHMFMEIPNLATPKNGLVQQPAIIVRIHIISYSYWVSGVEVSTPTFYAEDWGFDSLIHQS